MNRTSKPSRGILNAVRRIKRFAGEDSSDSSDDESTRQVVLTNSGFDEAPSVVMGRIEKYNFTAMIDCASPATAFTTKVSGFEGYLPCRCFIR